MLPSLYNAWNDSTAMAWREFKDCPICGEEMLTWRETQQTCSKACQGIAARRSRNYPVHEWGELYQNGFTYKQIADKYGVSYAVVRVNTKSAGYPARDSHSHLRKYDAPRKGH